jgi:hypothetical protein
MHGRGRADASVRLHAPDALAAFGHDGVEAAIAGADVDDAVGEQRRGRVIVVVEHERVRRHAPDAAVAEVVAPRLAAVDPVELVQEAVVAGDVHRIVGHRGRAVDRAAGDEGPQRRPVGQPDREQHAIGVADIDGTVANGRCRVDCAAEPGAPDRSGSGRRFRRVRRRRQRGDTMHRDRVADQAVDDERVRVLHDEVQVLGFDREFPVAFRFGAAERNAVEVDDRDPGLHRQLAALGADDLEPGGGVVVRRAHGWIEPSTFDRGRLERRRATGCAQQQAGCENDLRDGRRRRARARVRRHGLSRSPSRGSPCTPCA